MYKFVSHSKLQEFIPDDTDYLTIMFEVTIKGGRVSLVGSSAIGVIAPGGSEETSAKKCLEHMRNVFHGGKFTDVTIV